MKARSPVFSFCGGHTHQFQGNCSPHYWKVLPECQLRGWKFLTSHRTNKHCTPALHPQPHPPPTLIKSSVSADTESGGGKDGEARTKAEEETADFGALKEMLLEVLLCLRALDPEKLNPKPGSGPVSGPLKVNLLCLTAAWIL